MAGIGGVENPTAVADSIVERLQKLFGPMPAPPPREPVKMVAHNGYADGQYRELKADVDNLKENYADLRKELREQGVTLGTQIRELGQAVTTSIESVRTSGWDTAKLMGVGVGVCTLILSLVYFYSQQQQRFTDSTIASSAKDLSTNVAFTNEKITTSNQVIKDTFKGVTDDVKDVATALGNLRNMTIPRNELDYRIGDLKSDIKNLTDFKASVSALTGMEKRYDDRFNTVEKDIERLKSDIVSRRENEQHWQDFTDRLNLNSNRISEVARSTTGTSATDQIKQLQDAFQTFQNKFITSAPPPR